MKSILFTLLLLSIQFTLFAQLPDFEFHVVEEGRSMSKGTANALVVSWPKASTKVLDKNWKQYAKKFKGKLKYDSKQGEYFLDNAELKDMSENMVDVTAKITQKGEGAELVAWFNLGVTYLSSEEHAERFPAAEQFLKKFDLLVYAELMKEQLKEEQKKLKLMDKALKKIEKAKQKEEKAIEKQKKTIEKAEKAIDEAEKIIEEQNAAKAKQETEMEYQNQLIEKINAKIKEAKGK
ncbi:hypothetical protein [Aureispira anguillae]|uniref:Uncharacterized protein n=1 Tax=Aureispira anguillae TaxID=2864201 RepID=A0A915YJG8_9BACT|nr:hypothetical protein [Aureispira anguillae]BDS14243.1 hypothetical protein AsAng_0050220 [Aureispira anguillae]